MSDNGEQMDVFFLPEQEMTLEPLNVKGWILDVGGGGEGVIGQLEGASVIAIDRRAGELREALEASGDEGSCMRIIMDACELKFLDDSFAAATCFFSLMYMSPDVQTQVLKEIHRVLKPGGEVYLWDFVFSPREEQREPVVAYRLSIALPQKSIQTGYGCRWPEEARDLDYYSGLLENCGFAVVQASSEDAVLTLRGRKVSSVSSLEVT